LWLRRHRGHVVDHRLKALRLGCPRLGLPSLVLDDATWAPPGVDVTQGLWRTRSTLVCLLLLEDDTDVDAIRRWLREQPLTTAHLTPTLYALWAQSEEAAAHARV